MTKSVLYSIAATLIFALTSPAIGSEIGVQVGFSDGEASIIRAYYRDHSTNRSGKNKGTGRGRGSLPPGIAKNLARGKPLPPGIARQYLPAGLSGRLPPPPRGFERVIILSGKVLLVEVATQVIHDVLEDVFLGQ